MIYDAPAFPARSGWGWNIACVAPCLAFVIRVLPFSRCLHTVGSPLASTRGDWQMLDKCKETSSYQPTGHPLHTSPPLRTCFWESSRRSPHPGSHKNEHGRAARTSDLQRGQGGKTTRARSSLAASAPPSPPLLGRKKGTINFQFTFSLT